MSEQENGMNDQSATQSAAQDYWQQVMNFTERAVVIEAVGYIPRESTAKKFRRCMAYIIATQSEAIINHQTKLNSDLEAILND